MSMLDQPALYLTALPVAGYVIGSTPFAVLIARGCGVDLQKQGSGNVGATNVGRTCGAAWGYLCFALDVLKGLLPTLAAGWLLSGLGGEGPPSALAQAGWLAAGCGCILGHVFSFYLRFRGGKGVATSLGVVLGVYPYFTWPGLAALGIWIAVTLASRYVSLGSVVAALAFGPVFVLANLGLLAELWPLGAFAAAMVALIVLRHRANLVRLVRGTENRIGSKRRESPAAPPSSSS